MSEGAIRVVERRLAEATADNDWWADACARAASHGPAVLPELFPALARRLGRGLIGGGRTAEPAVSAPGRAAVVDLDAWRVCDGAGHHLIAGCGAISEQQIVDLFLHGDFEERAIVMRAQGLRPVDGATAALLGEAQRTNTATHFEALVCESNLAARAVGQAGLTLDDFNRLILKTAFLDLRLARMFEAEDHANVELSRMLQDFATEREAAGRTVWADTDRLLGLAPARGTLLRLIGALEHGADGRRRLSAEALARLDAPDLVELVRDRAEREPVAATREILQSIVAKWRG